MPQLIALLGYPIQHSVSPAFQQAALDFCGIDARYQAWETPPEALPQAMARLCAEGVLGANVTVPHKEAVLPFLVAVDDWAEQVGAVNTIVNQQGRLLGYNTDSEGFLRALREDGSLEPRGVRVLLLGAGGAAKGVALALAAEGVASMTIANRTASRAEALAEQVRSQLPGVEVVPWMGPDTTRAAQNADLIVNCTSLGMRHGPDEGTSPFSARQISPGCLVYDLVYNPSETPLLREARRAGARTLGGLPMLVYQGAASFRLWTGREAPVDIMMRAALRAMSSS